MKIYYVIPNFEIIGAQRIAIDFGNKLLKKGDDVFWISGGLGPLKKEVKKNRIILFSPKLKKIPKIRLLEQLLRLLFIVRSIDQSVIVSITPFLNRYLCFLKKIGFIKSRLIIEDHAIPQISNKDEFPFIFTRWFYESTVWLYNYCDKMRVLSLECKNYYKKKLHNRSKIIMYPNLLNLKRILNLSKNKNNLPLKRKKRIVYIGRLTTQKNLEFIIKSFSNIKFNNLELFIIGTGPQKEYLKSLVIILGLKNRVFFLKSSKQNYSILKTADLFVMASLWEGMPITICEAMLLDIPVVCTDFLAGPRFYLGKNSLRGWIVPKNDMVSFTKAIEYVLLNSKKIKNHKIRAKSFILKKMDINRNINEYKKIFFNY